MIMRLMVISLLTAILAGCSLFESEEARVSFTFVNYSQLKRDMISLSFSDGKRIWRLNGSDFESGYDGPHSSGSTRLFNTATTGDLKVSFQLIDGGKLVSSGWIELPLRSDWGWSIDFVPAPARRNPFDACFGCSGARAVALDSLYTESPTDSMNVIWGGNSIKHPVVY